MTGRSRLGKLKRDSFVYVDPGKTTPRLPDGIDHSAAAPHQPVCHPHHGLVRSGERRHASKIAGQCQLGSRRISVTSSYETGRRRASDAGVAVDEDRLVIAPSCEEREELSHVLLRDRNKTWRRLVNIMERQSQVPAGVRCAQLRKRRRRIENADDTIRLSRGDQLQHSRERTDEDRHPTGADRAPPRPSGAAPRSLVRRYWCC